MFARLTRTIAAPLRNMTSSSRLPIVPRYRVIQQQSQRQTRFSSTTQGPNEPKPEGSLNTKSFYKTFGRPIAKTSLLAIFVYQVVYYFWVRLEQNEARAEMQATITDLEARISKLEQAKVQEK